MGKRKLSAYNRHVQREMKKGKTMKQAAASWKRGGKKSKPRSSASKSKSKGGSNTTAKGGFNTNKLYGLIRKLALLAPAIYHGLMREGTPQQKAIRVFGRYTGFDLSTGQFSWANLMEGYLPFLGAVVATKGIPKVAGIIRGL